MKRFGNPGIATVRCAFGPSAHASLMVGLSRPVIRIGRM